MRKINLFYWQKESLFYLLKLLPGEELYSAKLPWLEVPLWMFEKGVINSWRLFYTSAILLRWDLVDPLCNPWPQEVCRFLCPTVGGLQVLMSFYRSFACFNVFLEVCRLLYPSAGALLETDDPFSSIWNRFLVDPLQFLKVKTWLLQVLSRNTGLRINCS